MQIARLLFSQGFGARRECEGLVASGRVRVGGAVVDDPFAETDATTIEVDGVAWPVHAKAVVMLHKPAGYECSQKPRHHPSVLSLLPAPLRTYLQKFPDIKVGIYRSRLNEIPRQVMDRAVDVGFVKDEPAFHELQWVEVHADELVCIASPRHPLASPSAERPRTARSAGSVSGGRRRRRSS